MAYLVINDHVVQVDDAYAHDMSLREYKLYSLHGEVIGCMQAGVLQMMGLPVPICYAEQIRDLTREAQLKAYKEFKIYPILKLITNNKDYIHYLIDMKAPVDFIGREGGQYYSYIQNKEGEWVLYGATNGTFLDLNIRHGVEACQDKRLIALKDKYFHEALAKLLEYAKLEDVCKSAEIHHHKKDPCTIIPPCGEGEDRHPPHCEWCQEYGMSGLHNWHGDTTVYDDGRHTHGTPYGRLACTKKSNGCSSCSGCSDKCKGRCGCKCKK